MIVTTEWGTRTPWGDSATKDRETAEGIVKNMKSAGHEAEVIWRGVTAWIPQDGMD